MRKFNCVVILAICLFMFVSCSSVKNKLIPTENKGGYIINNTKSKVNLEEVDIEGTVFDVQTGKPIALGVQLEFGCIKIKLLSDGKYSFKTRNVKDFPDFIGVIAFGYRRIETANIDTQYKRKVRVDFYLSEDDRPFIDCVPQKIIDK